MTKHTSIDKVLVDFLTEIDPDQIIPDEISYSADRSRQYKAPDHFMFDRRILVERKTLNTNEATIRDRFDKVTLEQGAQYILFGEQSLDAIFRSLDEPQRAFDSFAKITVNKLEQRIKEARDKFSEHARETGIHAATRLVICSEDGDSSVNDGRMYEQHIAGMFWNRSSARDKTGLIDSIIYVRDPEYTISQDNGHWFKWLTRKDATAEQRKDIARFGEMVFRRLLEHFAASGRNVSGFEAVRHAIV